MEITVLAFSGANSAIALAPAEGTWRIYTDPPFPVPSSNFPNLLPRQAAVLGTELGSTAVVVSCREVLFCKLTTTMSKLNGSLMSNWRDKTVVFMKPSGACLFELGSLNEQLAAAMVIVSTCISCCFLGLPFKLLQEMGFGFSLRFKFFSCMLQHCTTFSDPWH